MRELHLHWQYGSSTSLQSSSACAMQQISLSQSSDGQGRKTAIQKTAPQQGNENSERPDREERVSVTPLPTPRHYILTRSFRARACKTCRKRSIQPYTSALNSGADKPPEVRCSGDTPRCANCERNNLTCVYDPARRDRLGEYVKLDSLLGYMYANSTGPCG
jgi:hypothetical protein